MAQRAQQQLEKLRGCDAHFSAILSETDARIYKKLGIHVSCQPQYETKRLYHR